MVHGLAIETTGRGPDVALLHGLPQPPDDLRPLARDLGAVGFRTHLVHLPGYGRSPPTSGNHDLDAVADAVAAALRDLRVEAVAWIGMSCGFYRAVQLCTQPHAPRPWALVGLGPLARLDDEARALFRGAAEAVQARADLSQVLVERFLSPDFAARDAAVRQRVARMIEAASPETVAAELRAFSAAPDRLDALRALDIPVFLRAGGLDVPAPPDEVRAIAAAAPRGRCEIVPGKGHLLDLEDYEGTLAAVRAALEDAVGRP